MKMEIKRTSNSGRYRVAFENGFYYVQQKLTDGSWWTACKYRRESNAYGEMDKREAAYTRFAHGIK